MNRKLGGIIRRTLCLICCAALLTGCGKGGKITQESGVAPTAKTLAAELSDRLDNEDYDLTLRLIGGVSDSAAYRIVRCGKNGLVTMKMNSIYYEFYTIDGETYMLLPEIQCYKRSEEPGGFVSPFLKLGKSDMLYDIEETGSEITEIYKSSDSTVKKSVYVTFDKATKAVIKSVAEEEGSLATIIEVDDLSWRTEQLAMPDISSWSNISDGIGITEEVSLKVSFYTRGITPEMVEKAGYTYAEIAKLDSDRIEEISRELLENK